MEETNNEFPNNYVLPFVRLAEVEIKNFKCITYGKIILACQKNHVPYNTTSDILGIYGQNGSGKSALIDSLTILEKALRGEEIEGKYTEYISSGQDRSHFAFTFDFQYPNGTTRTVKYEFDLGAIQKDSKENNVLFQIGLNKEYAEVYGKDTFSIKTPAKKVVISNEIIKASGVFNGKNIKMQPIFDTSVSRGIFGPASKIDFYLNTQKALNDDKDLITDLTVSKRLASEKSTSFVFFDDTIKLLQTYGNDSDYYHVIHELSYFGRYFFSVVDSAGFGMIRQNNFSQLNTFPIYIRGTGLLPIDQSGNLPYPDHVCNAVEEILERISIVLGEIVPGLSVSLKRTLKTKLSEEVNGYCISLFAKRNAVERPLYTESDGIKKLISILALLIAAFDDSSFTLVVDELDAGIYEYLLGEILDDFQKYGKGQLIFTSHNLRPLEILDKDFVIFTTTNPENRFIRLKNIASSHNLRDRYYHEIVMGGQDEELYTQADNFRIIKAFRQAGEENEKDKEEIKKA